MQATPQLTEAPMKKILKKINKDTWFHHFGTGWQYLEFESDEHARKWCAAGGTEYIGDEVEQLMKVAA